MRRFVQYTLAVAYSHLFFNITGIFIWCVIWPLPSSCHADAIIIVPSPPSSHPSPPRRRYVIWPLRALPIAMARALGDITATYRW